MPQVKPNLLDLDHDALESLLESIGQPRYRTNQIWQWLYKQLATDMQDMTSLPKALRAKLEEATVLYTPQIIATQESLTGETRKDLLEMRDGEQVEVVLMRYTDRRTVCISTQVGCAIGCQFCATGQMGFQRNLSSGEIVAQVLHFERVLQAQGRRVTNVVFMGMGEPLANYERVEEAIKRIVEDMEMSPRRLTVSTVGLVPGMLRLAENPWPVNLAVSLHAADDELRNTLVPINRRYPLADVEAAAATYFENKGRRVSIEWTMIDNVNDTLEQATRLSGIAKRLGAHVNVIPLNATPLSQDQPSPRSRIASFVRHLRSLEVNVTIRDTRGADIDAACGQLRAGQA